jgi:hypothetical protein
MSSLRVPNKFCYQDLRRKTNWSDCLGAVLHSSLHCAECSVANAIFHLLVTRPLCAVLNVALFSALDQSGVPIGWAIAIAFVVATAANYLWDYGIMVMGLVTMFSKSLTTPRRLCWQFRSEAICSLP